MSQNVLHDGLTFRRRPQRCVFLLAAMVGVTWGRPSTFQLSTTLPTPTQPTPVLVKDLGNLRIHVSQHQKGKDILVTFFLYDHRPCVWRGEAQVMKICVSQLLNDLFEAPPSSTQHSTIPCEPPHKVNCNPKHQLCVSRFTILPR